MGGDERKPTGGVLADGDGVEQFGHLGTTGLHPLQRLQQVPRNDAMLVNPDAHRHKAHGDHQGLGHVRVGVLLAQDGVPHVHEQPHQHLHTSLSTQNFARGLEHLSA